MNNAEIYKTLSQIDCSNHTEKLEVGGRQLTYLSWTWALNEFRKYCPDMEWEVVEDPDGHLAWHNETGYMVKTRVSADGGKTWKKMHLPVMDSSNRAMLDHPYEITTKYGKKIPVAAATATDINKAVMRCVAKNIAINFGLGFYIYAGEDLPEVYATDAQIDALKKKIAEFGCTEEQALANLKLKAFENMPIQTYNTFFGTVQFWIQEKHKKAAAEADGYLNLSGQQ